VLCLQSAERGAQNNGLTAAKTWRYARVKSSLLAFLPPPARDSGNRIHPKDHHSSRGVQPCLARRASSAREQQPARLSHQCHLFRLRANAVQLIITTLSYQMLGQNNRTILQLHSSQVQHFPFSPLVPLPFRS
jgi:hypothetical protein